MYDPFDTAIVFGFLTLFQVMGGIALGAGIRHGRRLPVAWGALIGGAPLYVGIERLAATGSWTGAFWQVATLGLCAVLTATRPSRLGRLVARQCVEKMMAGTLIMTLGGTTGALLYARGSDVLSVMLGGAGFLFGAMWFGSGIQQLREQA